MCPGSIAKLVHGMFLRGKRDVFVVLDFWLGSLPAVYASSNIQTYPHWSIGLHMLRKAQSTLSRYIFIQKLSDKPKID
ncbi:uncharacterized protein DS421_13g388650 [Arachis hypogaea]|nr:uncharacterized protein DS421_13g388650 [Arachis hypogaea]